MVQNIIVYIIIGIALLGAVRFGYGKWKALRKRKPCNSCSSCPLKDSCTAKPDKPGKNKKGSCCSG